MGTTIREKKTPKMKPMQRKSKDIANQVFSFRLSQYEQKSKYEKQ